MKSDRLVLVSNRIPISFQAHDDDGRLDGVPSSGGLVSALEPLLEERGGTWIGAASVPDSPRLREILDEAGTKQGFRYAPLFLTTEEQANFYDGFANEILWPLFHDLQSLCNFEPRYWEFYESVNAKFADAVEGVAHDGDIVWIQDYHLMRVAHVLRTRGSNARLAFFLHTPFPPPDIFAKLPWRAQILEGLLAHELVGVQTARDERNLVACLREFAPAQSEPMRTRIEAFPISIDFAAFEADAGSGPVRERVAQLREKAGEARVVISVDRLDYTKGIPQRIKSFGRLLKTHPELRGKVELLQVVIPSRERIPRYEELRHEVEQLVAHVNGEHGEPGWVPINYMHRSVSRDELLALYCAAEVGLVTSLKDGMNLVAKEYCAAKVDDDGVLVLSEFAGAAPELGNAAILINPNDEVGVAAALKAALDMEPAARRTRMRRLREQIRRFDIHAWRDRYFAALSAQGD